MTGSFSSRFARRKTWKTDKRLLAVLNGLATRPDQVLDVGAGIGLYVEHLRERGVYAFGVDGIEGVHKLSDGRVSQLDMTDTTAWLDIRQIAPRFDLVMCIEVGEHIPEQHLQAFLDNLDRIVTRRYLISWGVPGQRGHNHVSCRSPEWVANEFGKRGIALDEQKTIAARKLAGKGWDRKLLVFDRS